MGSQSYQGDVAQTWGASLQQACACTVCWPEESVETQDEDPESTLTKSLVALKLTLPESDNLNICP